jgi:hypothetical protein
VPDGDGIDHAFDQRRLGCLDCMAAKLLEQAGEAADIIAHALCEDLGAVETEELCKHGADIRRGAGLGGLQPAVRSGVSGAHWCRNPVPVISAASAASAGSAQPSRAAWRDRRTSAAEVFVPHATRGGRANLRRLPGFRGCGPS